MSLNFNQIILAGRLAAKPELKTTPSGKSFTSFSLAVDRPPKEGKTEADFFPVTAWGQTAEFITRYFEKGRPIFIVGRAQNRSWDDPLSGQKRHITEVIVSFANFVDNKPAGNGTYSPPSTPYYQGGQSGGASGMIPGVGQSGGQQTAMNAPSYQPLDETEEELPF